MSISLYVHIPFCIKRCIYCDFVSGIYDPEKCNAYVTALKKEILNIPNNTPLSTLYIGGGTPTVLSADALADLIKRIFGHFHFEESYEATIEANPGTLDKEKLQAIRSSGINRISIGIQSFHDNELAFLGRIHTGEEAKQTVHLARDAGFENIGVDLIYGIPGQDINSWKKTLQNAVSLRPKHISAYELTVEKGTVLHKILTDLPVSPFRKRGLSNPLLKGAQVGLSEDKIIEMYEYTIDYLSSHGYSHYEISNFAMLNYFCRHNLNYWDRGEYYGAGQGAHSFIKGKRFYNSCNLDNYIKAVSENKSPVEATENITEDNALSESLFLGLRKIEGIDVESFAKRYKKNIIVHYAKEIKDIQEAGLIEITDSGRSYKNRLKLTRKGLLLSNEIFERFI
jgi:oxygen-independent coproporphyrinogen-3 oxidase